MILVVGGAHSGKRTFVREKLGFAADARAEALGAADFANLSARLAPLG